MMKQTTEVNKNLIISHIKGGQSVESLSLKYAIPKNLIHNWISEYDDDSSIVSKPLSFLQTQIRTSKTITKLQPYKTIIIVLVSIIIFYSGWVYASKDGNYFTTLLYPLYVAILIGMIVTIKYRHSLINEIDRKYLILEVKWSCIFIVLLSIATIFVTVTKSLAFGFLLVFYFLIIAGVFNTALIVRFLKDTNNY